MTDSIKQTPWKREKQHKCQAIQKWKLVTRQDNTVDYFKNDYHCNDSKIGFSLNYIVRKATLNNYQKKDTNYFQDIKQLLRERSEISAIHEKAGDERTI